MIVRHLTRHLLELLAVEAQYTGEQGCKFGMSEDMDHGATRLLAWVRWCIQSE